MNRTLFWFRGNSEQLLVSAGAKPSRCRWRRSQSWALLTSLISLFEFLPLGHHLLSSALTRGADRVSGSGPALLCPGMSEWAFSGHFEDVLVVLHTCRMLVFWPL